MISVPFTECTLNHLISRENKMKEWTNTYLSEDIYDAETGKFLRLCEDRTGLAVLRELQPTS